MRNACPGSVRINEPVPEIKPCPYCGKEIEMWSDECTAVCPVCGAGITREVFEHCYDWCPSARICAGDLTYKRYMRTKKYMREQKREG